MQEIQTRKAATAGTNDLSTSLPVGAIIKRVMAYNKTKHWQLTDLWLGTQPTKIEPVIALVDRGIQCGNRHIVWEGESFTIGYKWIYIGARFGGCDAGDELFLHIGYEMPRDPNWRWPW